MLARLALDEEIETFVELVRGHVEEMRADHGFDAEITRQTFRQYLETADPTIYFAEHRREVVGYMMVSVGSSRYADLQYLIQEVIFVRPEHRGTRAAVILMKHLTAEARRQGFTEILGGNDYGFDPTRTQRFLEHFGFAAVGLFMRLRIE